MLCEIFFFSFYNSLESRDFLVFKYILKVVKVINYGVFFL